MSAPPTLSAGSPLAPPMGFETLQQICEMPSSRLRSEPIVNVVGFVREYKPPIKTRGTDYKCTMSIVDPSTADPVQFHIFWDVYKMPKIEGPGDVVLIRNVKARMYGGEVGLLATHHTQIHVLRQIDVPQTKTIHKHMRWTSYPPTGILPKPAEEMYVLQASQALATLELPTMQEFEEQVTKATTVKDKFALLKDVQPDSFHDIIGQVVRIYDPKSFHVSVYLSDFTANSKFHKYTWDGEPDATVGSRDGDEHGYLAPKVKVDHTWPGPFGKLAIQLTIYDEHADFIRHNVSEGSWILLKNVQFRMSNLGNVLEGRLRHDANAFAGKVHIKVMEQAEEAEHNDPRWVECLKRKLQYERKFKRQRKELLAETSHPGASKRNITEVDEGPRDNAKKRRKERRAMTNAKVKASEAKAEDQLDLNPNVRCCSSDMPILPLSAILQRQPIPMKQSTDTKVLAPFTVFKYRANVRVVDYFPHHVEDFAVGRQVTEYDMLSDYSDEDDSNDSDGTTPLRLGQGSPAKHWEWRFALQIEDASAGDDEQKQLVWLMVDNEAAQMLLSLEHDATDLRRHPTLLQELKEQLFKLWGELEERKSAQLADVAEALPLKQPPSSDQPCLPDSSLPEAGKMPDLDSDSESDKPPPAKRDSVLMEPDADTSASTNPQTLTEAAQHPQEYPAEDTAMSIRNRAFTCCIKQYGVTVPESDERKADAGNGMKYERRFGLFGTTIH